MKLVTEAVGKAAAKATEALGEVQDAIVAGKDASSAIEDYKTAVAELLGQSEGDVTVQETAHNNAVGALEAGEGGGDRKPALAELQQAHNELVNAISAQPGNKGEEKSASVTAAQPPVDNARVEPGAEQLSQP